MSVWVKSLKGDKELHRQQVVNLKRNKREKMRQLQKSGRKMRNECTI